MTGETLRQTIIEITEMTFETLAFIFAVPAPEHAGEICGQAHADLLRVRVHFDGPVAGALVLSMPQSMLPDLAENMLGMMDKRTTVEQRRDAACELCNVICGNLLPALAGPTPVFSVSPPELCDDDPPAPDSATTVSARVWLDPGWVEVRFTVSDGLELLEAISRSAEERSDLESVA